MPSDEKLDSFDRPQVRCQRVEVPGDFDPLEHGGLLQRLKQDFQVLPKVRGIEIFNRLLSGEGLDLPLGELAADTGTSISADKAPFGFHLIDKFDKIPLGEGEFHDGFVKTQP